MQCYRSSEIVPSAPLPFIELAAAKDFLGISGDTEDALLTSLINVASQTIEKYCNRILTTRTVTEFIETEESARSFILGNAPIAALTSIAFDGAEIAAEELHVSLSSGILRRLDSTNFARGRYVATYTAGVAAANLDAPIIQAAKELVKEIYLAKGRSAAIQRESVPDVADVTYIDPFPITGPNGVRLPMTVAALVAPWVNHYGV